MFSAPNWWLNKRCDGTYDLNWKKQTWPTLSGIAAVPTPLLTDGRHTTPPLADGLGEQKLRNRLGWGIEGVGVFLSFQHITKGFLIFKIR